MENELDIAYAYDYALGGKAELVFVNEGTGETGGRFQIVKNKYGNWYVYNTMTSPSTYLGFIRGDVFIPIADWVDIAAYRVKVFRAVWQRIVMRKLPEGEKLKILHTGICSICYKKLKDEISLRRGVGPKCWARLGKG